MPDDLAYSQYNFPYGGQSYPQQPMNMSQFFGGQQNQQNPQNQFMQQHPSSTLMQGLPAILSAFGMIGNMNANTQANQLSKQSSNLANAVTNTNNPLYQQLYGQYKQQNIQNAAQAANMLQGQNRMMANMGRVPLFARGREGEQAFRNIVGGYQNANVEAQNQARNTLMQGLQGNQSALRGITGNYGSLSDINNMRNASNLGGFNSIADLMRGFGNL